MNMRCAQVGLGVLFAFALRSAAIAADVTPLHLAALGPAAEAVAAQLAEGADVQAIDARGRTALHYAALNGRTETVALLIGAGADVSARDNAGDTPLHLAARRAQGGAIDLLLAAGADPMALNAAGQTPLHVLGAAAREAGKDAELHLQVLAADLIAAGADPVIIAHGLPALTPADDAAAPEDGVLTWPTYAEIGTTLQALETAYPTLARRYSLGVSVQGRNLWALKISDHVEVEENEPEFKYISTMHGDEIVGVEMCLLLCDHLLSHYGDPNYPLENKLVNGVEIWIVPLMNPDGYDRSPRTRGNANGVDLNRDFPDYGEANSTAGRQVETAIIMNWTGQHTFTCSANFHGGALVVNYPFDNEDTGSRYSPDDDLFQFISLEYSQTNLPMYNSTSFFHGITNGADWYFVYGGMQDWNYHFMGNNEVTIELGTTKQPAASLITQFWNDNRQSMLAYMATCLRGVSGLVTDVLDGTPLAVTVQVVGRNHNIYTDPDVGDYHRMLLPGTYALKFTATGYSPKTISNVVVTSGDATQLDVQLTPAARLLSPDGGEELPVNQPTQITWFGDPAAQFQVQVAKNYGATAATSDDFERTTLGPDYTTGGNQMWATSTTAAHAGTRSAKAGTIGNSQATWIQRVVGGGNVSFWWRVSSESGYDFFNFSVDGTQKIHASGTAASWQLYSETLPAGTHTLRWEYTKDVSQTAGSDTAWIDDLAVVADQTVWTDVAALTPAGATSTAWTPGEVGTTYRARVRARYSDATYSDWDTSAADFSVVAGPVLCAGDMNCDGSVDFADINKFVEALSGQAAWEANPANAGCPWLNGDTDGDDNVTFKDINPFVARLGATCD